MGLFDSLTNLFSGDEEVTHSGVLASIRKDYPQYAEIPDIQLAAAAARNDPKQYGFLSKFDPVAKVEPTVIPRPLRTDSFYQNHPDLARNDAIEDLTKIRSTFPAYANVPDEQLAAAAEQNDPTFKGLLARYKAPELEQIRIETYQKVADAIGGSLKQVKGSLVATSGAPAVEKFREAFNSTVSPQIEKLKAGIVSTIAPSDDDIVNLTQRTGKIPYPDIAYRTAVQTIVSAVPSTLEDFGLWAVTPEAIAVLKKVPGLRTSMTELFGLKGAARNPVVMPEGFEAPLKKQKPEFRFETLEQRALPPGETPGTIEPSAPRPGITPAPTQKAIPSGRTEGQGFTMREDPDLAAFQETRGYSPKRGEIITRQGYRAKGPSEELRTFERSLAPEDQTMLRELRYGVRNQVKSSELFRDKETGKYAPGREVVHKNIQARPEYNKPEAKAPEGEAPVIRFVIGPPAAGKSSGIKSLFGKEAYEKSVVVDNDEIKAMLPGWDPKRAELFHHESSDVEEQVIINAMENRYNITQPILGKNQNKVRKLMENFKANGYRVELYHVDLPANKAAGRTISRVREGGRYVDPAYVIDEVGLKPKQTYDRLKSEADAYGEVSNDVPIGEPPRFVERGSGDSAKLIRPGRGGAGRPDTSVRQSPEVQANLPAEVAPKAPEFGKTPTKTAQEDLFGGAPEDLTLRGEQALPVDPVRGTGEQTRITGTEASFSQAKPTYKAAGGAQLVPTSEISTDPTRFQPRRGLSDSRVKDLAEMIREQGYNPSKPITLWRDPQDGKLYTLAGHHRLAAAKSAGLDDIPAVIQNATPEGAIEIARRSNSTRAPMSAMEEARAFKAETDRGAGIEAISKNYGGIKTSDIARKLELNNLPSTLQDLVDQGQFPVNHAIELGRAAGAYKFSPTLQQEIFNEIVKKMDVTPAQFRTMMDTLGPAAAKQIDMGLGFQLDQGILSPLKELSSKMGALEKAKKQLSGYVKYIDSAAKRGEKVTNAQVVARNQAARQVKRLNQEIIQLQRSVGKAARARVPLSFAGRGQTGSVTLGGEPGGRQPAGPATQAVEGRIGTYSQGEPLKQKATEAIHQLYQDTIDRFHSISRYTQMATEGFTKPIKPGENPVLLARSYLGVSGKADAFLRYKTFRNTPEGNIEFLGEGLDETLRPMRDALPDLDNYLVARRTLELSKRDIQTGIDPETAVQSVIELEAKYPQIKKVADGIQDWNDDLLRYLVDSGRIGEHNYAAIKEANQFYAPMQRVMDEAANPEFYMKNKNVFNRVINPIKKVEGSRRKIISPIESMVRNTFSIMDAADRNAVARAVVRLRNLSPEMADLIQPLDVPHKHITILANGIMQMREGGATIGPEVLRGLPQSLHADVEKISSAKSASEIENALSQLYEHLLETGKDQKGSVREMWKSLFSSAPSQLRKTVARNLVMSPLPSNVPRGNSTITVYENGKPRNYIVPDDLRQTMMGLNEEGAGLLMKILSFPARMLRAGATLTPEFALRNPIRDQWNAMINSKYGFTPGFDVIKGLFSMTKADESFVRWQASGGAQAFLVSMNKAIDDVRYHPPKGYGAKFEEYVKNPLKVMEDLSELSEKPTRVGVFKKAKSSGASDIEAGFESREATTDFSRRGARTKSINAIYAFFNARLQGVEKTARAFRQRPVRSMMAAAPLVMASVYNYLAYKDDKEYQELPKYRRLMFWNFKVKDHWVSLPKGDVGVIFGGTAEKILEFIDKKDPSKLGKFASDVMEQISPIDVRGGGYIPTGLKPIVENVANYNFFRQRPIVPQGKQGLLPEYQFTNYDSEISKMVGKALGVSPAKVTNLVSGYTGGLGRYALEGADKLGTRTGQFPKRPETPKQPADLPLIRGFVARSPIGFGSNSVNDFYTNWQKINQARDSLKKLPQERRQIFYDNPEVVAYKGFERAAKALSLLRKKRELVMDSGMPVEKKKEIGDRIDEQVTNLARRMNEQYEKLRR